MGLDAAASEVLVNLITGSGLPDRGTVRVLDRMTSEIADGDAWLASLDRFGIVSERAVLLEGATVQQNLAMPFTLQIDPLPLETAEQVAALAQSVGLTGGGGEGWLMRPAGDAPPAIRARIHLARALALDPALLILEHPTGSVSGPDRAALAADTARVTDARRVATLIITQDQEYARAVAHRTLQLDAASGSVRPLRRGWFR
jgi:ABC-type lipoprotein export system ATPase subunit